MAFSGGLGKTTKGGTLNPRTRLSVIVALVVVVLLAVSYCIAPTANSRILAQPHQGYFEDVPAGQWFTGYVERLYELGLTKGCSETPRLYCPDQPVTRAQMAAFLVRALDPSAGLPDPAHVNSIIETVYIPCEGDIGPAVNAAVAAGKRVLIGPGQCTSSVQWDFPDNAHIEGSGSGAEG